MEDLPRLIVQYLHVLAGVMWVGAGFYTILVQTPALMAAPPPARGAVLATLAPRQIFYLLRIGELTIVTGFLRIVVSGRAREMSDLGSRWSVSILVGLVLAVVLLGLAHGVLKPGIRRLLSLGPQAAQGDQAAAGEAARLIARFRTIGYVQLALGLVIVGTMALARLS